MRYKIDEIDWDNSNVPHIFEHGFSESDIESLLFSSDWNPEPKKGPGGVLYIHGQSDPGRYGLVVTRVDQRKASLITVRDQGKKERQWYNAVKEPRYEPMPTGPGDEEDLWIWEQQFTT